MGAFHDAKFDPKKSTAQISATGKIKTGAFHDAKFDPKNFTAQISAQIPAHVCIEKLGLLICNHLQHPFSER